MDALQPADMPVQVVGSVFWVSRVLRLYLMMGGASWWPLLSSLFPSFKQHICHNPESNTYRPSRFIKMEFSVIKF